MLNINDEHSIMHNMQTVQLMIEGSTKWLIILEYICILGIRNNFSILTWKIPIACSVRQVGWSKSALVQVASKTVFPSWYIHNVNDVKTVRQRKKCKAEKKETCNWAIAKVLHTSKYIPNVQQFPLQFYDPQFLFHSMSLLFW